MKRIKIITSLPLQFLKKCVGLGLILVMLAVLVVLPLQIAQAGLTGVSAALSRLAINATANHTIEFTTVTPVVAGETIVVDWANEFDLGVLAFADIIFTGATLVATCAAGTDEVTVLIDNTPLVRTATFTVCTGDTVAIGAKTIVFGNERITNPATAASYSIDIGGTMADSGTALVHIIPDDRVVVEARVMEHLTFSITDVGIGFGSLDAGGARWATGDGLGAPAATSAHDFLVSTNATAGYTVTINGTTLTSAAGDTIEAIGPTAVASTPGTEQFGIRISATGGVGAAVAPFNHATNYAFDGIAPADIVAQSTAASDTTTFSVHYLANIGAITEAGIYTTSLTYVATANF